MRCFLIRIFHITKGFLQACSLLFPPQSFLLHYTDALLSFIKNGNSFFKAALNAETFLFMPTGLKLLQIRQQPLKITSMNLTD